MGSPPPPAPRTRRDAWTRRERASRFPSFPVCIRGVMHGGRLRFYKLNFALFTSNLRHLPLLRTNSESRDRILEWDRDLNQERKRDQECH
ncbi:hypothetical protein EVAR_8316_1 [Eumeta japonica]|uniref:Uncharacterized protein n=1 Tax=Eumeta variegata TaxID=151549 RepID=A0A4C1VCX3_EUMVA|nr:hypothetical protein EVAR_8316_1 [Eumeta japonica]